jgi:3-oxoacyl-[acyl-carrier protein] reductase
MDLGLKTAKVFVAASRSGLGEAAAHHFCLEGAQVTLNGRHAEALEATAERMRSATGQNVYISPADLTQTQATRDAIHSAAAQMGGLDILMTNAGGPPPGRFEDFTPEQWQLAFDNLVMSVVNMVQAALPYLRQSAIPSVLVLTSVTLKEPAPNLILSNVMRAGLAGLIKSLANQYGPEGIRVNGIIPGWTATERVGEILREASTRTNATIEELMAERTRSIPLGRMGQPEEFARAAVFLASPAASFITGTLLAVDGGQIKSTM